MSYSTPAGKSFAKRAMVSRTWSESSIAFEPGRWKIGIASAGWLSSSARSEYESCPNSTRAISDKRVNWPWSPTLIITCSNSSILFKRPLTFNNIWNWLSLEIGCAPKLPAATCWFWARNAATTSVAVNSRDAKASGFSHTRMAYLPPPNKRISPTPDKRAISSLMFRSA